MIQSVEPSLQVKKKLRAKASKLIRSHLLSGPWQMKPVEDAGIAVCESMDHVRNPAAEFVSLLQ
jgi:hypothetical protein